MKLENESYWDGGEPKTQRIWRENQGLERIQAINEEDPENIVVWSILKSKQKKQARYALGEETSTPSENDEEVVNGYFRWGRGSENESEYGERRSECGLRGGTNKKRMTEDPRREHTESSNRTEWEGQKVPEEECLL